MKKFLRKTLAGPVEFLANRFSSSPKKVSVFKALNDLYNAIVTGKENAPGIMLHAEAATARFIIFSDQHKGKRDGADDFRTNETNYLQALSYYHENDFHLINLGDSEELWENNILEIIKHNKAVHAAEAKFIAGKQYGKIYGNHDNFWRFDPLAGQYLKSMFGQSIPVHEGIVLQLKTADNTVIKLLLTHGHQGDSKSDDNWFSAAFVGYIWAPLQSFLGINPNSPSTNTALKTRHNQMMYEWSALSAGLVLITGHTHQPVFKSHTHLERLYIKLDDAMKANDEVLADTIRNEIPKRMQQFNHVEAGFRNMRPSYFNSGCCCYNNGNITGIEIADNCIRLVKWTQKNGLAYREVAEEMSLNDLATALQAGALPSK